MRNFQVILAFRILEVDYTVEELLPIIKQAKEVISAEPMLLEVRVPCVIVGDIHGQVCTPNLQSRPGMYVRTV